MQVVKSTARVPVCRCTCWRASSSRPCYRRPSDASAAAPVGDECCPATSSCGRDGWRQVARA